MQIKDRIRKKYYSIRKKKYFDVEPNFFYPLNELILKKYDKKIINLSIYYPSSFEVNTLQFFKTNLKDNIKTFLPAVRNKNSMNFYKWKSKEVLKVNNFGMLEPYLQLNKIIPHIILVPLLAYDNKKNRLGYGKGFYDRYLKKYLKKYNCILTIGIAFSFQRHHELPVTSNDVQLNYILTEKGIF